MDDSQGTILLNLKYAIQEPLDEWISPMVSGL